MDEYVNTKSREWLKALFENGDVPTEDDFTLLIDSTHNSLAHRNETISPVLTIVQTNSAEWLELNSKITALQAIDHDSLDQSSDISALNTRVTALEGSTGSGNIASDLEALTTRVTTIEAIDHTQYDQSEQITSVASNITTLTTDLNQISIKVNNLESIDHSIYDQTTQITTLSSDVVVLNDRVTVLENVDYSDLDQSGQIQQLSTRVSTLESINHSDLDQSDQIQSLSTRVNTLESINHSDLDQSAQVDALSADVDTLDQKVNSLDFFSLTNTPDSYTGTRNSTLQVDPSGDVIFANDAFVVDAEFRGVFSGLTLHKEQLLVEAGQEFNITAISSSTIFWTSPNGALRFMRIVDEYGGPSGQDLYIRIDDGEPTCTGGADYDPETNSCFPVDAQVIAASTFQDVYDPELATNASGSYGYPAKIRILKTGNYARGYIDLNQLYNDVQDIKIQQLTINSDITNLKADVQTLQARDRSETSGTYTVDQLPLAGSNADMAIATDGSYTNTPTMVYYYEGAWYRAIDDTLVVDNNIQIYLIAGQSNAHGHSVVSDLTQDQQTQSGLFYTSWHQNTSNASTDQYFSPWAMELIAGSTRGDSNQSVLGGSNYFGPELGFVNRANEISLTNNRPVAVLKYAIGASSLTDDPNDPTRLSDWDLIATGERSGDAMRGLKVAIDDAITKLTNAGYKYTIAGVIWWQGESGGANNDLVAFIEHVREWLDDNYTLNVPRSQLPFVITGTDTFWGTTYEQYVANLDAYIGFVNTQDLAAPAGATRTLIHPGSNETYAATQSDVDAGIATTVGEQIGGSDFNNDGVNDMFTIGRAYADQLAVAAQGSTTSLTPLDSTTIKLWVDGNDMSVMTRESGVITQLTDKSSNNYIFTPGVGSTIQYKTNAANGRNALVFDGDVDYMDTEPNATLPASDVQDWFIVAAPTTNNGQDAMWSAQGTGVAITFIPQGDWLWYYNNVAVSTAQQPGGTSPYDLAIYVIRWDQTNNQVSTWVNGVPIDVQRVASSVTGGIQVNNKSGIRHRFFGQYGTTPGTRITDGAFCEAVISDIPSNREAIEGYLAWKWGATNLLPTNHPYKLNAP